MKNPIRSGPEYSNNSSNNNNNNNHIEVHSNCLSNVGVT